VKENQSHILYLEALLALECEERDRHAIENRTRDAQLPRMKTLEEFDFAQAPQIPAAKIRELAEGGYIERNEPVVLIGEWNGQEPSGNRPVSGSMSAEAAGALYNRRRSGE
jgi:DNA replication protein DnaC